jgi:hypothetical protein
MVFDLHQDILDKSQELMEKAKRRKKSKQKRLGQLPSSVSFAIQALENSPFVSPVADEEFGSPPPLLSLEEYAAGAGLSSSQNSPPIVCITDSPVRRRRSGQQRRQRLDFDNEWRSIVTPLVDD